MCRRSCLRWAWYRTWCLTREAMRRFATRLWLRTLAMGVDLRFACYAVQEVVFIVIISCVVSGFIVMFAILVMLPTIHPELSLLFYSIFFTCHFSRVYSKHYEDYEHYDKIQPNQRYYRYLHGIGRRPIRLQWSMPSYSLVADFSNVSRQPCAALSSGAPCPSGACSACARPPSG